MATLRYSPRQGKQVTSSQLVQARFAEHHIYRFWLGTALPDTGIENRIEYLACVKRGIQLAGAR